MYERTIERRVKKAELMKEMLCSANLYRLCCEDSHDKDNAVDNILGHFLKELEDWCEFEGFGGRVPMSDESWDQCADHIFKWAGLL